MKDYKITLGLLLLNLFIAFLGIGLVIPVLPTLMNELQLSGQVIGYLTAAFAIAQLIVSPLAGKAVDKYGRKIMIVLGLFIFGISEFLFGLGKTIEVLFISRILGGISAAFIMPAVTAFIADITTMETRPKALGYMSAAISTGFIIGPGIGGFLADFVHACPSTLQVHSVQQQQFYRSFYYANRNVMRKTRKMHLYKHPDSNGF